MELINIAEILGTIAFAASGALLAIEKKLDYYGVMVLAVTTAIGGGILRDVMLGHIPPVSFSTPLYFGLSIVTAFITIWTERLFHRYSLAFKWLDALGLAAFTVIGAKVASEMSCEIDNLYIIVIMGVLTGTGGGMIRDVLAKEIPFVLKKREVYAVATIVGSLFYGLTYRYLPNTIVELITFILTFGIRIFCFYKNIYLAQAKSCKQQGDASNFTSNVNNLKNTQNINDKKTKYK